MGFDYREEEVKRGSLGASWQQFVLETTDQCSCRGCCWKCMKEGRLLDGRDS